MDAQIEGKRIGGAVAFGQVGADRATLDLLLGFSWLFF